MTREMPALPPVPELRRRVNGHSNGLLTETLCDALVLLAALRAREEQRSQPATVRRDNDAVLRDVAYGFARGRCAFAHELDLEDNEAPCAECMKRGLDEYFGYVEESSPATSPTPHEHRCAEALDLSGRTCGSRKFCRCECGWIMRSRTNDWVAPDTREPASTAPATPNVYGVLTSAVRRASEVLDYHGCISGGCPHEGWADCETALIADVSRAILDDPAYHAALQHALEEPPLPATSETPHPEAKCERCGRDNVTWFTPSHLWNAVIRENTNGADSMLCPVCFIQLAEMAGHNSAAWRVEPEPLAMQGESERTARSEDGLRSSPSALHPTAKANAPVAPIEEDRAAPVSGIPELTHASIESVLIDFRDVVWEEARQCQHRDHDSCAHADRIVTAERRALTVLASPRISGEGTPEDTATLEALRQAIEQRRLSWSSRRGDQVSEDVAPEIDHLVKEIDRASLDDDYRIKDRR